MADHGEQREVFHEGDHPHEYEHRDANAKLLLLAGAAGVVLLLLSVAAVQLYYDWYKEGEIYQKVLAPPGEQLRDLRAREDAELGSFRYLDRQKGIVRIPIERAMELYAEEAAERKFRYPTNPMPVKTPEQLAAGAPAPRAEAPKPR